LSKRVPYLRSVSQAQMTWLAGYSYSSLCASLRLCRNRHFICRLQSPPAN